VIDVVLQEQIRGTDVGEDFQRLGRAVDEEAGNVARVDRFEEQPDARIMEARRGAPQVFNEGVAGTARQSSAVAYEIARSTPSSNSRTRSGWQAMPRSPALQFPAGRLCNTCVRPCSSSRCLS
jgi:hypothetical protein